MAGIFRETYSLDNRVPERRCNCSECGRRRLCYDTELVVDVEALGGRGSSAIFPDLKQVCMACAEERAFLITGKRKVRM